MGHVVRLIPTVYGEPYVKPARTTTPIVRRQLSAAERTVNPGGCLLREEGLVTIVMPASSMDGRFAGGKPRPSHESSYIRRSDE